MGACNDGATIKAESVSDLKKKFKELQEELAYQHGHSYSGTLAECSGIKVVNCPETEKNDIFAWIWDKCEKWEEALAVEVEEGVYLVGGMCSC